MSLLSRKPARTAGVIPGMGISMARDDSLLRLLQLVSPSLPTGGYSYSQGLEWAVEAGWVNCPATLEAWLVDLLHHSMALTDVPLLLRMARACSDNDDRALARWCDILHACRESSELRQEEQNRGKALSLLLARLSINLSDKRRRLISRSQLAGFAQAAVAWEIGQREMVLGYLWSWLENQVLVGIKSIPLGQTEGQQLLLCLGRHATAVLETGSALADEEIGAASPAFALASALHETQYSRLYRS